jgi:hypothetical protein
MRAIFEAYQMLRSADPSRWPVLEQVDVCVTGPEEFAIGADALVIPDQGMGWVRHRSGVRRIGEPPGADFGPPLFAEWTEDPGKSARLAPHPEKPGRLALWRYVEENGVWPIPALAQDIAVLDSSFDPDSKAEEAPLVLYRVYWGAPTEDPSAFRRLFARFVGFSTASEYAGRKIVIRPATYARQKS